MPKRLMTLTRHIAETERKWHPEATGTFTRLLWDVSLAARLVSREVNKAGLAEIVGAVGSVNATGDAQQKLDMFAETHFLTLAEGGYLCAVASEEQENLIPIPEGCAHGNYVFVFDPLDGSSNIGVNASVGTVFGIYRRVSPEGGPGALRDALQRGDALVAAGYVMYGASTILVYSTGQGVHGFTLDPSLGEFVLSHSNIRMPERGSVYSVNEGNQRTWNAPTRAFVDRLKDPEALGRTRPYKLRYIGTLVADFHRTLLQGGVFLYPADCTGDAPNPKLRLVYEGNPIAWLAEQAGGKATTGEERILSVQPHELHQRVSVIVGSRFEVGLYEEMVQAGVGAV